MAVTGGNKLLYVVNDAEYFVTHRLALALAARAAGYRVAVASGEASRHPAIVAAGLQAFDIPIRRGRGSVPAELRTIATLRRILRAERFDLVHAVTLKASLAAGIAARFSPPRAIIFAITGLGHVFSADDRGTRVFRRLLVPLLRVALRGPGRRRTIFQNRGDMALLQDLALTPRDESRLIRGSGVDIGRYAPAAEPPGAVVVLFPARMLVQKGVRTVVAAARILKTSHPTVRMLLAGGLDPDNPSGIAEEEIRGWERENMIEWLGHQSDMVATLAACHIVCLPTFYGEGVPRALIEAAAVARPIVASDIAGCREIVEDGVSGLLVAPREPAALADALARLIDDPGLRRRFGEAGRARVVSELSLDRVIADTLSLYREALA